MKAQSALEFLSTYGWAILILGTVTILFVNFGLNNPELYSNERCLFESDFTCREYSVVFDGAETIVTVFLVNNLPYTINITNYEFEVLSGISGIVEHSFGSENPVRAGEIFELHSVIKNPRFGIDLFKAKVYVVYEVQRPGFFQKNVYGSIVSKIN
jgi:hypothetical protein